MNLIRSSSIIFALLLTAQSWATTVLGPACEELLTEKTPHITIPAFSASIKEKFETLPAETLLKKIFVPEEFARINELGRGAMSSVHTIEPTHPGQRPLLFPMSQIIPTRLHGKPLANYVIKRTRFEVPVYLRRDINLYYGLRNDLAEDRFRSAPQFENIEVADTNYIILNDYSFLMIQEKSHGEDLETILTRHLDYIVTVYNRISKVPYNSGQFESATDAATELYKILFEIESEKKYVLIQRPENPELWEVTANLKRYRILDKTSARLTAANSELLLFNLARDLNPPAANMPWGKKAFPGNPELAWAREITNIDAGFKNYHFVRSSNTGRLRMKIFDW